jgi:hypothetical protein
MGVGIVMVIVAVIVIVFNLFTVPAPVGSPTVHIPQVVRVSTSNPWPYPVIMPEDIGRLESEVYKVCEQYANLDLSGMVQLCKRVGYQE